MWEGSGIVICTIISADFMGLVQSDACRRYNLYIITTCHSKITTAY